MSDWISTTERLPELDRGWSATVLVCVDHRYTGGEVVVDTDRLCPPAGKWNRNEFNIVTHWMPIPNPPVKN